MSAAPSAARIIAASAAALALAALLLVTLILPAEYGWDPLGSGAALGLLDLAGSEDSPLRAQDAPWTRDEISFRLAPFEAVEYKYRMRAGAVLLFDWQAQGEVVYDLHAEPDGAAPGFARSFDRSRAAGAAGSYSAPFDGIHGWFWQNRGDREITLRLRSSGYFSAATEFRDGRSFHYDLAAGAQP